MIVSPPTVSEITCGLLTRYVTAPPPSVPSAQSSLNTLIRNPRQARVSTSSGFAQITLAPLHRLATTSSGAHRPWFPFLRYVSIHSRLRTKRAIHFPVSGRYYSDGG